MHKEKGFTLIELMVVIAIIGVLAAMIMVGWGAYQDRADDVVVTNNMNQLASFAESVRARDGDYGELTNEPEFTEIENEHPAGEDITVEMGADEQNRENRRYCAYTTMISDDSEYYCVDYNYNRGRVDDVSNCESPNYSCQ